MFEKILIPLDGSDASQKAVLAARSLAEKYHSEVIGLYVIMPQVSGVEEYVSQNLGSAARIPPADDFDLFKKLRQIFSDTEIPLKNRVEMGFPAKVIVDVAKEEQVSLIVMGSRGLSGLSMLFLGSVSKKVVNDAECPVFVVK